MSLRLVQLRSGESRRVAVVEEPNLRLLAAESIYALAGGAIGRSAKLSDVVREKFTNDIVEYDGVYVGMSPWRILPAIDHPADAARCLISGTGLTHLGSARDRQAMHLNVSPQQPAEPLTDSMKMFRWGLESGRPEAGCIGTSPEWFYKGTGAILRAHNEPLELPTYAEDGGEEAEIAGVYVVGVDGKPYRIGMTTGNEFSDHCLEKRNYLYLASSKLRNCAIGPELVVDPEFSSVPGEVTIQRGNQIIWSKKIRTGEAEMCHSLQNIEHHHFKFDQHRRPGDIHVHFFGADCLSFGEGVRLLNDDRMQISFDGFGRPLRNALRIEAKTSALTRVVAME
jgi:hypothetical protein